MGRRLTRTASGSSVRETPFTATYDEANRMTAITLTGTNQSFSLAYDDNGNLISKTETGNPSNVTTYSWDSRNRLIGIQSAQAAASFKYDGLNRRVEKTVNGQTTRYVYDGPQAIVEVAGGDRINVLAGLDADEVIARYAASGRTIYLQDALNSVIAQAKDDQSIQNYYAYTPYGETTPLGPDNANPLQFTGRENDQTGLYYYRARYYDPLLKRFVSEDPIGIAGGLR